MQIPECPSCSAVLYHLIRERMVHIRERSSMELNITGYDGSIPAVGYSVGKQKDWLEKGGGGRRHIEDHDVVGSDEYHVRCPYCGEEVDITQYGWAFDQYGGIYAATKKMEDLL